ncbi:hypothetical protein HYH02_008254 [Chlamydomonas schloesseri]|uniref:Uncharacterized protein n=1 Tax=Chlamydomonas schloesseri TaxID=2026947 RepID=A0A835WG37_9CHLO|nr:hypothetical protein HYH02_008254 [Chlamydomonas schloesseri]|eukprot:KAG2446688.1 hypothetical protein HYH02_008254 [Chlamydomonas schloesseri]
MRGQLSAVTQQQEEQQRGSTPIDVVGVSLKPSCVTRASVHALNAYLKPRVIHVVTTNAEKCRIFASFAPNVECHIQDELLGGLTVDAVGAYIEQHLGIDQHKHFKGRELSGWYMQQFLKLGSALALPQLSQHYVVWDLDMILLRPVQVLFPPGPSDPAGSPTRTLVNIGGSVSPGYMATFRQLMRRPLEFAPDGTSFVTHWMVVYKPYLLEFLRELSQGAPGNSKSRSGGGSSSRLRGGGGGGGGGGGSSVGDSSGSVAGRELHAEAARRDVDSGAAGRRLSSSSDAGDDDAGIGDTGEVSGASRGLRQQQQHAAATTPGSDQASATRGLDPLGWVWRILSAVEPSSADLGFSEYASYISWVRQRYPASQQLAESKTWIRHPFGQGTVKLLRLLRTDRCCCPSAWLLRLVRLLGFVYTGYEVGHIEECRYSEPQYAASYGL